MKELQWARINSGGTISGGGGGTEYTERLKIPEGWLYRTTINPYQIGASPAVAMVFVPVTRPEKP